MKHIERRYLFQKSLGEVEETLNKVGTEIFLKDKDILKKAKNNDIYIKTDQEIVYRAFSYNHYGQAAIIPIPDLTLVYFDAAYNYNRVRKEYEKKLLEKILVSKKITEDATQEVFTYYGNACGCIILLFTSIESFINYMIPDDGKYEKDEKSRTEIYNKSQIQRHIDFYDKLKKVLPSVYNKNFFNKQTPTNQHIESLKKIRDDIIHTKSEKKFSTQEDLIKRMLKFKYEETFDAVATFMNFYNLDYIKECKCGADF